jgi:hypothetical protein
MRILRRYGRRSIQAPLSGRDRLLRAFVFYVMPKKGLAS